MTHHTDLKAIANTINNSSDFSAKLWEGASETRVYVKQFGRIELGYIAVNEDGERNAQIKTRKGSFASALRLAGIDLRDW